MLVFLKWYVKASIIVNQVHQRRMEFPINSSISNKMSYQITKKNLLIQDHKESQTKTKGNTIWKQWKNGKTRNKSFQDATA